ncbi:hypothetical protein P7C71_g2007, partial [Lecanoromycetidae sp. Uapishka_2]
MEDGQHTTSNDASVGASSHEQDDSTLAREHNHGASGHRRSLSGSLSAFLFQRPSGQSSDHTNSDSSPTMSTQEDAPSSPRSAGGAMAMAVQQKGIRKRKGSLRKTALLGTGKLRAENKERRGSQLEQATTLGSNDNYTGLAITSSPPSPVGSFDLPTPRPISSVPPPVPMVTHPIHGDPSKISSAQTNESKAYPSIPRPQTADSTASTTDEEDSPTSLSAIPPLLKKLPDSYFPQQPPRIPVTRATTASSRSSPLASLPPTVPSPTPAEWDYSETRWWGWVILTVTWIVFVVGMGSCFEVWSWAWDVGETPYAPPELEDDPTLPIVGYYPALIVLTTVMAWLWVTVAWVGMKYFKHANISGDEE